MRFFLLIYLLCSFLKVQGDEHIWNVGMEEAFQTVMLKENEIGKEGMMADRDWDVFERVNKPFQCSLPDGPMLKKEDIHISTVSFRLRDLFMIPNVENGFVTSWKLVNQEGYETGTIEVFLGSSPKYLRRYLRTIYQMNCARVMDKSWMMDKTTKGGIWYMCYTHVNQGAVFLALKGNLAITMDVVSERKQVRFNIEDVQELFRLLVGEKKYEFPGDDLKFALEKKRKRAIARERKREEERRKREEVWELEKWKKDPCYQMPSLCDEVMAYDSSRAPVGLLKHGEVLNEELIIPNTHEGRITLDMVKKWGGKSFQVMEGVGHLRNGMHAELEPCGKLEETMEHGARVEILVAHARSRKEAMELLLKLRFYDLRNTKRDPKDVAASTVIKPRKVGDFDLGCGPVLGADGALVKGSEQSAVYFLRGNTAVMVISTDPGYPVLGMARKLDAALQGKGIK